LETAMGAQAELEPAMGFVRLHEIIGDRKRGIPALIPVCASTWWAGVRTGQYPPALKISRNVTVWRRSEVLALLQRLSERGQLQARV
jgi:prophage regulatory protein